MDRFEEVFGVSEATSPQVKDFLSRKAALVLVDAMDGKKVTQEAIQAARICSQPLYPQQTLPSGLSLRISAEDITKALIQAGLRPKAIEAKIID